MADNLRVVMLHGAYGDPSENWLPWLAGEARALGAEVLIPTLPTPEGQNLNNWRQAFKEQVGELGSDMILVGHSIGAGFILNLLEESRWAVRAMFLVSGFVGKLGLDEFDLINESFVCRDFDWGKIRSNAGAAYVYNSDNDPYVPLSKGQELAARLGVALVTIKGGGHINASAGFLDFPRLLDDLRVVLSKS